MPAPQQLRRNPHSIERRVCCQLQYRNEGPNRSERAKHVGAKVVVQFGVGGRQYIQGVEHSCVVDEESNVVSFRSGACDLLRIRDVECQRYHSRVVHRCARARC